MFTVEATKVAYTILPLTGRAWLWATAEWERQLEACSTILAFAAELRKVFGLGTSAVGTPPGKGPCLIILLTSAHWQAGPS